MPIFNTTLVHRIFRAAWVLILVAAVAAVFYFGFSIICPFLIAWLLAYMMNPIVRFLENRWKFRRGFAVMTALLLFAAIIAGVLYIFTTKIISESWHIMG
ncbi:AI-2E family transporter, partial [Paenibacillus sp.]